jgi:hypothetical protein
MTSLAVAIGGEVNVALVINEAYEVFGFFRSSRVDMAQPPVQRKGARPDQIGWVLNRL